jgi:hypothetical protein
MVCSVSAAVRYPTAAEFPLDRVALGEGGFEAIHNVGHLTASASGTKLWFRVAEEQDRLRQQSPERPDQWQRPPSVSMRDKFLQFG